MMRGYGRGYRWQYRMTGLPGWMRESYYPSYNYPPRFSLEEELRMLEEEKQMLENELEGIKRRIEEIKKEIERR